MLFILALTTAISGLASSAPTLQIPAPFEHISDRASIAPQGDVSLKHNKRELGGVKLCTEPHFAGSCWHGVYPLDTCVALNGYAGHTLSFLPDEQTRCFVMQGQCNADAPYVDLEPKTALDNDLSGVPWISNATSYFCFKMA